MQEEAKLTPKTLGPQHLLGQAGDCPQMELLLGVNIEKWLKCVLHYLDMALAKCQKIIFAWPHLPLDLICLLTVISDATTAIALSSNTASHLGHPTEQELGYGMASSMPTEV
ncbi:hypothetical protein P7K49_013669, partial [Saguinus oedipus]